MSGGSSANNSWTILTPEETVAKTLRPLAEGTEHHEESPTSATGSAENQPASGAESAEGLPVEGHPVSEEKTAELSGDTSTEQHTPMATAAVTVPTSLEESGSYAPGNDALSQSESLPEGPAPSSPDPDSFSDSYTHVTPSSDEHPDTLSTETLGGVELAQEEQRLTQEGTLHQQEEVESNLGQRMTDVGKQADSPVESEVAEQRPVKTAEEGEPGVRRRRSLLAALERIGRTEEEEEKGEEFQLPQREDNSGFSVNKCILGAVILLGLGTIFFSGVFMDLDEESDYGTRELKDAELPGKQEWLNPEAVPPVDADSTELLNKLAKGNQQISALQGQLQAQKDELKVAKGQAAEGAKERLRWEEVEKENSRLKKEMASLPVLQKENQRMKRELESVPALQKELETLRATVTESKHSPAPSEATQAPVKATTSPSSGQPEDSTQGTAGSTEGQLKKPDDRREKNKDMKKEKKEEKEREKSAWKEKEKRERKDGGKTEWKKGKHEQGKFDKEKYKDNLKGYSDETKQWKDKDGKKEKASRGDEGKPWKDREGDKEWKEKSERKEWKKEKDWKKAKHEEVNGGKQWRGKEEKKDWKVGKEHGEKHNGREEWKGEKEWKKGKDGYKESGKEKWEKKGWKEKGEKKEWKKDDDWKSKNGKDSKEGKWKGEKKQWEESKNHGKDRKGKDEGKQQNKNEWKSKNDNYDEELKRKDERKRRNENEWKSKNDNYDEELKRKDERKQQNENEWKSKNGKYENDWKRTDERKQWEKKEEQWKRGGRKEIKDWDRDTSSSHKRKDEHKFTGNHGHEEEHLWGDRKPSHTHRRPSLEQPEYWVKQRSRLQHNPKPPLQCNSLETCAQTEGLLPVPFPEFEALLQTYLAKAEEVGVDASVREELKKLTTEFFKDGVFAHDQMSFQDFVEDVGDVLEDMVEGDDDEEEEGSALEEEMEGFEREAMKRFSLPGAGEKEERSKGEWRKESGRGHG